jgi:hypothetical protein
MVDVVFIQGNAAACENIAIFLIMGGSLTFATQNEHPVMMY